MVDLAKRGEDDRLLRARRLFGTEEPVPEQLEVRAGPLTATFVQGQFRWISFGDIEVVRGIAFVVRDRDWNTILPRIDELVIDEEAGGFQIDLRATHVTRDGTFSVSSKVVGKADGSINFEATAVAGAEGMLTCRTGFVILHPLDGFVGCPMLVEHADGSTSETTVSDDILPTQPWFLVRAMTHVPRPGISVSLRMEGDTWETEDHRNWTDASFKTYCRPLAKPYPYLVPADSPVKQTVSLKVSGPVPSSAARSKAVSIDLGGESGAMPAIGLGVLPEDSVSALAASDLVRLVGPSHLNMRIDLRRQDWREALDRYLGLAHATGAQPVYEVIIPGARHPEDELRPLAEKLGPKPLTLMVTPAADLVSYPPGTPLPEGVPEWEAVASAARMLFPGVVLGGGMLANFPELNRKRPPQNLFDFVTHATAGTVHAADDASVMETLEAIPHIIRSLRRIYGTLPYRIGPSHIGASFNPNAPSSTPNPRSLRLTMARQDPRHRGLLGAAWHVGFLAELTGGGVEVATLAAPTGDFGLVFEGKLNPLFHVLRGVCASRGASRLDVRSSEPSRVRALAWRRGTETHIWLANQREQPVTIETSVGVKSRTKVSILDESSLDAAAVDSTFTDTTRDLSGGGLELGAYAVARLVIEQ